MSDLYERDFAAWATEQAALLRAGDLAAADIAHIAEEIDSMGRSEKRELISRLTILLLHLLKWRFQPERRGVSWQLSIVNARSDIADHLDDNPSLRANLPDSLEKAYRSARLKAAIETEIAVETFPASSPWSFDQAMRDEIATS